MGYRNEWIVDKSIRSIISTARKVSTMHVVYNYDLYAMWIREQKWKQQQLRVSNFKIENNVTQIEYKRRSWRKRPEKNVINKKQRSVICECIQWMRRKHTNSVCVVRVHTAQVECYEWDACWWRCKLFLLFFIRAMNCTCLSLTMLCDVVPSPCVCLCLIKFR